MVARRGMLFAAFAVVAAVGVVYALFDPAQTWWMPKCPVHLLTGFDCPGCGSQRAIHALLRGRVDEAFAHNALLVVMIPFISLTAYAELTRGRNPRLYRALAHPAVVVAVIVLVVVWAVLRNLFFRN